MTSLEKLNRFTRRELQEEEVYLFDVILCDNEIDRDAERFSENALAQMQELFIGKTGILDHNPSSSNQTARIYDTELIRSDDRKTKDGRPLVSLKAHAYMIRTDSNADFIREIDAGIKKEVSVSCRAGRQVCSVCGADRLEHPCSHIIGRKYGAKSCCVILDDIQDAYEWSFVAVPAQVAAGVTKQFGCVQPERAEDTAQNAIPPELQELLSGLEEQMRRDVVALCGRKNAVSKALCMAADKMDLQELLHFRHMLEEEQAQDVQAAEVQLAGSMYA